MAFLLNFVVFVQNPRLRTNPSEGRAISLQGLGLRTIPLTVRVICPQDPGLTTNASNWPCDLSSRPFIKHQSMRIQHF